MLPFSFREFVLGATWWYWPGRTSCYDHACGAVFRKRTKWGTVVEQLRLSPHK